MKSALFGLAIAAGSIAVCGCAEFRSSDIRLEKPLNSAHLSFSDNIRRFDVKLDRAMDLSSAAGVAFQVKCADPRVLTDCWLLFKTGHGYYRASFPVPKQAGTWTDAVVLKEDVRLYHWNSHISLYEVQLKPAQEDVPDWSRVTELQVVFSLEIDRTTADGSVAVRDFTPLAPDTPRVAVARAASRALREKRMSVVRAQPSVPRGRRFLATHVWGLDWNWDETCRMLKAGGITDVIPLMNYAGYAYYRGSKFEPPSPLMDEHGDGLQLCQAACRKHGLSCHPWRACWRMSQHTPKDRVEQLRKAGRLQVAFDGSSQYWFCPTHPENVQREIDGLLELARFGVRGILLDYFRYPGDDYCFCPRCRNLFEAKIGHAVEPWPGAIRKDAALAAEWSIFRRETLTGVLRTIRRELRRQAPELELSAAVTATPQDGVKRGQDWPQWCRENLLDRMFPMCYYSTSKLLRHDVEVQARVMKGSSTKLCPMTCFACGDIPFLELDEICRQISVVRSFGFEDLGFFRLTEYVPYVLEALRQGPLAEASAK